jgi:hypothetical protein
MKRQEYKYIDKGRNHKCLQKCFDSLVSHKKFKKHLKKLHSVVQAKGEKRLRRQFMYTLLIKYNKISLMNQLAVEIQNNRAFRLQKYGFSKWMFRYRYLT